MYVTIIVLMVLFEHPLYLVAHTANGDSSSFVAVTQAVEESTSQRKKGIFHYCTPRMPYLFAVLFFSVLFDTHTPSIQLDTEESRYA